MVLGNHAACMVSLFWHGCCYQVGVETKQERNNTLETIKTKGFARCWVVAHPWMMTFAVVAALAFFAVTKIAVNHNRAVRAMQWLGLEKTAVVLHETK